MNVFTQQATAAGVAVQSGTVVGIAADEHHQGRWVIDYEDESGGRVTISAAAVIIATGARPRMLDVPGQEEAWGRGLSTCALCDRFMAYDRDVVVVGGGASALEEIIQLAAYARSITVVMRGTSWRAPRVLIEKASSIPHTVIPSACVASIQSNSQTGEVEGVLLHCSGVPSYLPCQAIFLALGHVPVSQLVRGLVECTPEGSIIVDARARTSVPGIFAAGDVTNSHYRQAIMAAASGAIAGLEAVEYAKQ